MRSRRSSRDSIPSTAAEDGDDSYKPSTTLAEECRFATAQQLNQTHGSAKKQPPLSSDNGVWSTPAAAAQIEDPSDTTDEPALVESETATRPLNSLLSKEKMEDTRNKRRPRLRSDWACSLGTLAVTLVSALMLWAIVKSYQERQCDANGCRMSRMSPVYLKTEGFDSEHTRFASKYSLYLYRENGVDEDYPPKGVPVLFIPGNAGSYRQVRSIAAEAARHFRDVVSRDETFAKGRTRNLDFFTVDFNEDITAFHGQTVLDQAEYLNEAVAYILSLYHDSRKSTLDSDMPDPSSVIIFGHSMGGIVARTMLIMPNYRPNSINTIITMSAPHARPPVSFDRQIVKTYEDINNYWSRSYSEKWANNNPLWPVTLVSIAGGGRDNVVPSDYASISSLVPDTHGFTVYTTSIPDVWLGVDHLAILWCDQVMKAVARMMLDIVDVTRPEQTKQRAERMRIMKRWLLTSLEEGTEKTLSHHQTKPTTLLTLEDNSPNVTSLGERLVLRNLGESQKPNAYLMPIPPLGVRSGSTKFSLLTDQSLEAGRNGKLEVLFCTAWPLQAGHSAALLSMNMDLSGDSAGSTRMGCKTAANDVIRLPASTPDSRYSFDDRTPFSYLEFKLEELGDDNFEFVAIVDKASKRTPGWVIAEFVTTRDTEIRSNIGLGSLLIDGVHTTLPAERSMVTDIHIPIIHSGLFAYKLNLSPQKCGGSLFAPLVRQHLAEPFESKFFVNVKDADINLHGTAPYLPPPLQPNVKRGLSLQIWSDPTCGTPIDISIEMDFIGSLGRLVMRYRTVFAAFPLLVVALVFRKQFQEYDNFGRFISFSDGMDLFISQTLKYVLLGLSLLAVSLSFTKSEPNNGVPSPLDRRSESHPRNAAQMQFPKNDMLIGLQDPFFWFLAPLFAMIAVGITVVLNYMIMATLYAVTKIYTVIDNLSKKDPKPTGNTLFSANSPRRRIIGTSFLLLFVATIVPYQFAYLVACIIQLLTCIRALKCAKDNGCSERSGTAWNFYNYSHSLLIVMLWILPINIPVLVVWHHNLAVHWLTPFSSHHNLLSIVPFILLVETLTTGNMIPRVTTNVKYVTSLILLGIATYSALYGVTYAYQLHHLVNILAAWFVAIHFSTTRPTLAGLLEIFTDDSDDSEKKRHQ